VVAASQLITRANRRLWPARGMVVDPGVQVLGWTREQVIAFVLEGGRLEGPAAEAVVDRSIVWAGQLTAYDTGALEMSALRAQAQAGSGTRFELREFHRVVLEHGAVTLPMLRAQVERWIGQSRNLR
jgi:uncharacterized protein (DUF885 family)